MKGRDDEIGSRLPPPMAHMYRREESLHMFLGAKRNALLPSNMGLTLVVLDGRVWLMEGRAGLEDWGHTARRGKGG